MRHSFVCANRKSPVSLIAALFAVVVLAAVCLVQVSGVFADIGTEALDTSFGSGGKVTTDFFSRNDNAAAVAIQDDGKIVAAGSAQTVNQGYDFALARYNTDGSLDDSFGTGGKVTTDFFGRSDQIGAVAIQADGKILAAGFSGNGVPHTVFSMARYNTDGSLDTSFGTGGKVTSDQMGDGSVKIAFQSDGKIIAVGGSLSVPVPKGNSVVVLRFNQDGSLDTTFGSSGVVTTQLSARFDVGVAVQQDDSILVGGDGSTVSNPFVSDTALVRLNPDGTPDTGFGVGGLLTASLFPPSHITIAVDPNGQILLAGSTKGVNAIGTDFQMSRFNPDGTPDTTFGDGGSGSVATDFSNRDDFADVISFQTDGKIILAGASQTNASAESQDFAIARYNTDGSLDTTFGDGGKATTDFFGKTDVAEALAIQQDGSIVAAGSAFVGPTSANFALARYMPTSSSSGGGSASFALSAAGGGTTLDPGASTTFTVSVDLTGTGTLTDPVSLSASVSPSTGVTADISPSSVVASGTAMLTLTAAADAAPGPYVVTVTGSSGSITQTTMVTVTVSSGGGGSSGGVTVAFNPGTVTVSRKSKATVELDITRPSGFTGTVTITPPDTSSLGIKLKPQQTITTTASSVSYRLKVMKFASIGQQLLTFTVQDSTGATQTVVLTVQVQ